MHKPAKDLRFLDSLFALRKKMCAEPSRLFTKCTVGFCAERTSRSWPVPTFWTAGGSNSRPPALRTNGGSGHISLSGHGVKAASRLIRSHAGRRVFTRVSAWSCTPVVHKLATKESS
jgi:hypothetical protein